MNVGAFSEQLLRKASSIPQPRKIPAKRGEWIYALLFQAEAERP